MVEANAERLNDAIVYERDLNYDYFGFKTLERAISSKTNGEIAERPQHMLMRVAVGIHGADIDRALKTYDLVLTGLRSPTPLRPCSTVAHPPGVSAVPAHDAGRFTRWHL